MKLYCAGGSNDLTEKFAELIEFNSSRTFHVSDGCSDTFEFRLGDLPTILNSVLEFIVRTAVMQKTILAFVVLLGTLPTVSWGQSPRYQPPAGSTIPRSLNYFRRDTGVLDPYNSFIEPQRQIDQRINTVNTMQRLQFNQYSRDIREIRKSTAADTGSNASFFNSSHYYPALQGKIGGRGAP
jgi:hypothetical protein